MMPRSISLLVLTGLIACLGLAFLQIMRPFLLTLLLAAVLAMLLQPVFRYVLDKVGNRRQIAAAITAMGMLGSVLLPLLIGLIVGVTQLASWSREFYTSPDSREVLKRIYDEMQIGALVHRLQPYFDHSTDTAALDNVPAGSADAPDTATPPDGVKSETASVPTIKSAPAMPSTPASEWEAKVTKAVEKNIPKLLESLSTKTMGLAASTLGLFGVFVEFGLTFAIFIIALYFFLADGPMLMAASRELLPVEQAHQERLLDQFARVTRAVVLGTFAAAIAQAITTGIGLYFVGIERVMLLTVVAGIVAIVPLAGTSLVWIPCAIWLWHANASTSAVVLFVLYNMIVVASVDNLVRAYVLNSDVKLHPLIAFVSVMGGIQWVGIWGVFVGPVLASCLYALMKIFKEELLLYGKQPAAEPAVAAVVAVPPAVVAQPAVVADTPAAKPAPAPGNKAKSLRKAANKRR